MRIEYAQVDVPTACVQGGKDPQDASRCRSLSAKEPLVIGFFCRMWPIKIRHPMTLRHPVSALASSLFAPSKCHSLSAPPLIPFPVSFTLSLSFYLSVRLPLSLSLARVRSLSSLSHTRLLSFARSLSLTWTYVSGGIPSKSFVGRFLASRISHSKTPCIV